MLLILARISLVALVLVGGYCLHGFGFSNGFYASMTKLTEASRFDDGTSYNPNFTGIVALDTFLLPLLTYFWPVCSGEHPYLSAHCLLFGGQFVAAWTITLIEGRRKRNSWRIASFTTVVGLMFQSAGAALILPAFLALHLLTTSADELATEDHEPHYVPEPDLLALPYSISLGYILPTVLMCLPSPKVLLQQSKIYAILVWQAFPLWVELFQLGLSKTVFSAGLPASNKSRARQIRLYGRAYLFAFYVAMAVHIACVAMSVSSTYIAWKSGSEMSSKLRLTHFFIPPDPLSQRKVSTIAEGAFWFIQYDYLITSIAYLVWSVAMRYGGSKGQDHFGVRQVLDLGGSVLIAGPMATALTVIWERDDNILYAKKSKETQRYEDKKDR